VILLPYPVSANRYWRTFRNRTVRSAEATKYRKEAQLAFLLAGSKKIDGPVRVAIKFHPRANKDGGASKSRLDIDNVIKVTLDALNGLAYDDDKQVVAVSAELSTPIPCGGLTVTMEAA
jgi:crossover junction endodeoxyribonuclease RusA